MTMFVYFVVRFYEGVVELALYAALKRDPQGLALHFYRNGEPHGDIQGEDAFIARYCRQLMMVNISFATKRNMTSPLVKLKECWKKALSDCNKT